MIVKITYFSYFVISVFKTVPILKRQETPQLHSFDKKFDVT